VYKWQVFLGGIASATFVLAGAAGPALAQTAASSPLTSVTQAVTGSQVTANVCDMAGSPLSGEVNSAMAGLTGQSCAGSSSSTPKNAAQTTSTAQTTGTAQSASTPMTTALPGLSAVTGEIPGLSSMSSTLPALNSAASSQAPALSPATSLTSAPSSTPLSNATVPGLTSNEPSTGGSVVQNTLNGVTGTLPVSSLTGGLPNLGSVTGALSGVTGPQN
jgi:hypothetical protein